MANAIKSDPSLTQQGPESDFSETVANSHTNTHKVEESLTSDSKPVMLEIPIFGAEHAQLAVSLGAGRLELNAEGSYGAGGTTPTLEELKSLRTTLPVGCETVPIRIMIRPRGARPNANEQDFIYSTLEYYAMCHAFVQFKQSGLLRAENGDGFVFGVLRHTPHSNGTDDGSGDKVEGEVEVEVDIEKNANLVNIARPFACVFHRAFDDILGGGDQAEEIKKKKERKAFEEVKQCGFDGILTSGGKGNAPENKERLGRILALAKETTSLGDGKEKRVEIIVGGGVRSGNLGGLRDALSLDSKAQGDDGEDWGKPECWFHSSCLTRRSGVLDFDGEEVKALVRGLKGTDG